MWILFFLVGMLLFGVSLLCVLCFSCMCGFSNSEKNFDPETTIRKRKPSWLVNPIPIIYLSTPEGIMANYKQVEDLWRVARAAGRSIQIASRYLPLHYDQTLINFCNIFQVPPTISCTERTMQTVAKANPNCIIINSNGINPYYNKPILYGLPEKTATRSKVDFAEVPCIAGYIHEATISAKRISGYFRVHDLSGKYVQYLPILMRALIKTMKVPFNAKVVVYHWRRGDQIASRCNQSREAQTLDTSVNCKDATQFIDVAKIALEKLKINSTSQNLIRYVATNENNASVLNTLRESGFVLFSNIEKGFLRSAGLQFRKSRLNRFLLEVLLMCNAEYFFHWGFSEVHYFVDHCRADKAKRGNADSKAVT